MKLYSIMFQSGMFYGIEGTPVEIENSICMPFALASSEASRFVGAELVLAGMAFCRHIDRMEQL